jgi:hypothetical protein
MNQIYSLSKQRFKNEITDKEFRVKRRQVLERNFGYRSHLVSVEKGNEHSDAKTIVPGITKDEVSQSDLPSDSKPTDTQSINEGVHPAQTGSTDKPKAAAFEANERKESADNERHSSSDSSTTPVRDKVEPAVSNNDSYDASSNNSRASKSDFVSASAYQTPSETGKKFPLVPVAAVLVLVFGGAGFYFLQSGDDLQSLQSQDVSNQVSGQRVDLTKQFAQLVEEQNYTDQSIAMFLNFWPLAEQAEKDTFFAELDEKILELDPEISDRLAYIQTLIRQSENDLVKQTKAILNGARSNNAFAQLTRQWDVATAAQKNVFIDYISSAYQDYIVDFDNEQNVLIVEEVLIQLDITSSVKSVDLPAPSPAVESALTQVSNDNTPADTSTANAEQQASTEIANPVEKIVDNLVPVTVDKNTAVTVNLPAEIKPAPVVLKAAENLPVKVVTANTNEPELVVANLTNIEAVTSSINEILDKESLRNPTDSKELAELTRYLFTLIKSAYSETGKLGAKEDTFAVFEQHPRFPYHYYDIELFFTDKNMRKIQPDQKTDDAMRSLSKLFKNAEKPVRPAEI